jgi:hypothetical protein
MEEVIEVTVDTSRPAILFDADLDAGVAEFWKMTKNITEEEMSLYDNLMLLATLTPSQEVANALHLKWACDIPRKEIKYTTVLRSLLQNVNYTSNLHTLVDYEEGVTTHPKIVFAALNCIRKHLAYPMIVIDPADDPDTGESRIKTGTAKVFVVPRKSEKTAVM